MLAVSKKRSCGVAEELRQVPFLLMADLLLRFPLTSLLWSLLTLDFIINSLILNPLKFYTTIHFGMSSLIHSPAPSWRWWRTCTWPDLSHSPPCPRTSTKLRIDENNQSVNNIKHIKQSLIQSYSSRLIEESRMKELSTAQQRYIQLPGNRNRQNWQALLTGVSASRWHFETASRPPEPLVDMQKRDLS